MRSWQRLDHWAARVNPGLAVVAIVLTLVDGSIMLGRQAARPLPMDRAASGSRQTAAVEATRHEPPHDSTVAAAKPSFRRIYTLP
jgi:hypothetical protein